VTGAVLALDLGTQLGWAVSTFAKTAVFGSGSKSFALTRFDGGGVRYLRFRHFLNELREGCGPFDEIVFEEVHRHAGTAAAHVYGGFLAHLMEWAEEKETPYSGIGVGVWKKAVTGRGNASKTEVIQAMRGLGHNPEDNNEADALAILHYKIAHSHG